MDSEKQSEGFEGSVGGKLGEPGGGYYGGQEGTYCMEHWVWSINNEFWNTENKLNNKSKF